MALLFGAPVHAQATDVATKAEIEAYTRLHNRAMAELKSLIPVVQWPQDQDEAAYREACRVARAGADANLPRTQSLLEELQAAKPLTTTGDPERDLSFQTTHTELISMIGYFRDVLSQLSSTCAAVEQGNIAKAHDAANLTIEAGLKVQDSASIAIRSAKGEPGPPAKKAAVEALALSMDGVGIMSRHLFGMSESDETATKLASMAAGIRAEVKRIRQGYIADPASAGAAFGASVAEARANLPDQFDKVATLFETASARLSSGRFTEEDGDAFLMGVQASGIGKGYNASWALR